MGIHLFLHLRSSNKEKSPLYIDSKNREIIIQMHMEILCELHQTQSATVCIKGKNTAHMICFEKQGDRGDRCGLPRNLIYSSWLKELQDSKHAPGVPQAGTCDWALFCSRETRHKHSIVMAIYFIFALLYPCLLRFWETQCQKGMEVQNTLPRGWAPWNSSYVQNTPGQLFIHS